MFRPAPGCAQHLPRILHARSYTSGPTADSSARIAWTHHILAFKPSHTPAPQGTTARDGERDSAGSSGCTSAANAFMALCSTRTAEPEANLRRTELLNPKQIRAAANRNPMGLPIQALRAPNAGLEIRLEVYAHPSGC